MTTRKAQDEPIPVDALEESGDGLVIDFSTVTELAELPADDYLCMVKDFSSGKARSGQGKMTITYVIQEPEEFAGRSLRNDMSTQSHALFNLFNVLTALGEDPKVMKDSGTFKIVPENYVGRTCVVNTVSEEYPKESGTMRARVNRVRHADQWDEIQASSY